MISQMGDRDNKVIEWTPKKVVATGAGNYTVTSGPAVVGRLFVETAGVTVAIYNDTEHVWPGLTGLDEDEFLSAPLHCSKKIVLNFSAAGTAYVLYR